MKTNRNILFIVIGILAIFIIAMALSLAASSYPDGLEKVAENFGFMDKVTELLPEGFFLIPDYAFRGVENEYMQTSLAGFFGIIIIFLIFSIIYFIYKATTNEKSGKRAETGPVEQHKGQVWGVPKNNG